jgi:SAM-dependent methyltransferase
MNMEVSRTAISRMLKEIRAEFKMDDCLYLDYFPRSHSRFVDVLMRIPKVLQARILDVGCGSGIMSIVLAKLGYKVFTTDLFSKPCEDHIRKYNIVFQKHNIEVDSLPFKDEWFDLVLFSEVLEHLNYSPLIPLREIHRVMKKGGRLILTTPNICTLKNALWLLRGKNPIFMDLDRYYIDPKPIIWQDNRPFFQLHTRLYSADELRHLLDVAGLRVKDIHYSYAHGPLNQAQWKKGIHWFLATLLRLTQLSFLGDNILVVAEKE